MKIRKQLENLHLYIIDFFSKIESIFSKEEIKKVAALITFLLYMLLFLL